MRFRLAVALLGSLTVATGSSAQTAGTFDEPPAAESFRLGDDVLTALRDGGYQSPNNGDDFGTEAGPGAVATLLASAGAPTDRIILSVDALLVRMPGHILLLDTGSGRPANGALDRSLRLAGVSPDDITDVLVTHGHSDHVGGLVGADGKPAFPRAIVWISAREWAWMPTTDGTKSLAAAIGSQVRTFEPGREILPGVTPIALYGHTAGHVGYQIVSQGRMIEDIGDIAHSSIVSLAKPDWIGHMDEDPKSAARTRRAELRRLAASHTLVFAPHFPFPGVGWIVAKGDGYAWEPDREGLPQAASPQQTKR